MKHKHYDAIVAWDDAIVAWANGAEIEVSVNGCDWDPVKAPKWFPYWKYRIAKPKPRKETRWLWANKEGYTSNALCAEPPHGAYTIKLEWSATEFEVEE